MHELLKTHPKAAQVVKQWLLEKMLESIKDDSVPEDFKEAVIAMGIDEDRVADILKNSPRALFDVFDNHKLYIQIVVVNNGWWWTINDDKCETEYENRKAAEHAAVEKAFELLNNKL
jgi:hypothetical protein